MVNCFATSVLVGTVACSAILITGRVRVTGSWRVPQRSPSKNRGRRHSELQLS
jgi:hypothetical protein